MDHRHQNPNVKAVIAFEPGSNFVFPEGEVPEPVVNALDTLRGLPISKADFMALTKNPIVVYYLDDLPTKTTSVVTQDGWRAQLQMARRLWRDTINERGGDVRVLHLPESASAETRTFRFRVLK